MIVPGSLRTVPPGAWMWEQADDEPINVMHRHVRAPVDSPLGTFCLVLAHARCGDIPTYVYVLIAGAACWLKSYDVRRDAVEVDRPGGGARGA